MRCVSTGLGQPDMRLGRLDRALLYRAPVLRSECGEHKSHTHQAHSPHTPALARSSRSFRQWVRAQQLSGRNGTTTLVAITTTHIGVTGLASYHRYRRIGHVHWITSKHWTESVYSHSFGSREMSEL